MALQSTLIDGQWRDARSQGSFQAENPATREKLPAQYPTSEWKDCDDALNAAVIAAEKLRSVSAEQLATFLTRYAGRIDVRSEEFVKTAHLETGLAESPRLSKVELPRTTDQLRQAAAAVREGSWAMPTIDTKPNIRSYHAPLGPVLVFGPNNFPFAYNSAAGGDFVAAIAAGNPVIAKAHPSHPGTTRLFAEEALAALKETDLPLATVQLIYSITPEDGLRFVADPRLSAVGFTGSRLAGMKLKTAADAVGKPIYLEMSSVNPVVIFPGALAERGPAIVDEFIASSLAASGQFCVNPGIVILFAGETTERFIQGVKLKLETTPSGTLLSSGVANQLATSVKILQSAGAELVTGGAPAAAPGYHFANTLLRTTGKTFLNAARQMQTEAFGNASLMVVVKDVTEAAQVIEQFEGNLTGTLYSDSSGTDEAHYAALAPRLRHRVGRLLNDKMPTGVAVVPAMNHGGPFPATSHPGFTAVGIPATLRRFTMLQCFDNIRPQRLPAALQNKNPNGKMWRLIDGHWSQNDIAI